MIIDNPHKDLTEIRDKNTGILLGFTSIEPTEPFIKRPLRITCKPISKLPAEIVVENMGYITLEHLTHNVSSSVRLKQWKCSRVDWVRFLESEGKL